MLRTYLPLLHVTVLHANQKQLWSHTARATQVPTDFGAVVKARRKLPPLDSDMSEILSLLSRAGLNGGHRIKRVDSDQERNGATGVTKEEWEQVFKPAGACTIGNQLEAEIAVRFIAALNLQPGDVFLDIGSSTGGLCVTASLTAPASSVVGVELSPSRYERGRRALESMLSVLPREKPCGDVTFICGDANKPSTNEELRSALSRATVVFSAHQLLASFDPVDGGVNEKRIVTSLPWLNYLQPGTRFVSMAAVSPDLHTSDSDERRNDDPEGRNLLKLCGAYDMEKAYELTAKEKLRLALEYEVYSSDG